MGEAKRRVRLRQGDLTCGPQTIAHLRPCAIRSIEVHPCIEQRTRGGFHTERIHAAGGEGATRSKSATSSCQRERTVAVGTAKAVAE